MTQIQQISIQDAEAILESQDVLLLDSRDQRDYMSSHHPKAMLLGEHNQEHLLMKTAKERPVMVYCYLGHASIEKAKMFADFGFKHCYSVEGGFTAWKKQLQQTI